MHSVRLLMTEENLSDCLASGTFLISCPPEDLQEGMPVRVQVECGTSRRALNASYLNLEGDRVLAFDPIAPVAGTDSKKIRFTKPSDSFAYDEMGRTFLKMAGPGVTRGEKESGNFQRMDRSTFEVPRLCYGCGGSGKGERDHQHVWYPCEVCKGTGSCMVELYASDMTGEDFAQLSDAHYHQARAEYEAFVYEQHHARELSEPVEMLIPVTADINSVRLQNMAEKTEAKMARMADRAAKKAEKDAEKAMKKQARAEKQAKKLVMDLLG